MSSFAFSMHQTVIYMMGFKDQARDVRAIIRGRGERRDGNVYYVIEPFYEDGRPMKRRCVATHSLRELPPLRTNESQS